MSEMTDDRLRFMERALELAKEAQQQGEVPVGALVVLNGQIIGEGFNNREQSAIATRHAEIIAIERACLQLKAWRLTDADLYVTLEPCIMCAGALVQARLKRVFFGTPDPKGGGVISLYRILEDERLNHRIEVQEGPLGAESSKLLKDFFRSRRQDRSD